MIRVSNRRMEYELRLFRIDRIISYKTVGKLYSDPLVIMIQNNLFVEVLRKKGINKYDTVERWNRVFYHSDKTL